MVVSLAGRISGRCDTDTLHQLRRGLHGKRGEFDVSDGTRVRLGLGLRKFTPLLTPQGRSNANMAVSDGGYSRGPDGSAAGSRDMVAAEMNVRIEQNRGYGCVEHLGRKH